MRVITAKHIIEFNKRICSEYGNQHVVWRREQKNGCHIKHCIFGLKWSGLSYHKDDNGTEFHRIIESVADNKTTENDLKKWFVMMG